MIHSEMPEIGFYMDENPMNDDIYGSSMVRAHQLTLIEEYFAKRLSTDHRLSLILFLHVRFICIFLWILLFSRGCV